MSDFVGKMAILLVLIFTGKEKNLYILLKYWEGEWGEWVGEGSD